MVNRGYINKSYIDCEMPERFYYTELSIRTNHTLQETKDLEFMWAQKLIALKVE